MPLLFRFGGGWSLAGPFESLSPPNGLWHSVTLTRALKMCQSDWDLPANLGSRSVAGVLPRVRHYKHHKDIN